jgi:uridine kinase
MKFFGIKNPKAPLVIGICGRSCSGKGIITEALASANREIFALQADCYFKNNTSYTYKGYQCIEYIDCIHFDRLINNLHSLKEGRDTAIRIETPWMPQMNIEISHKDILKKRIIIIDGFLIFAIKELVDLFDYKIFVDVSDYNLLRRRLIRNGFGDFNSICDVVIPISKKYEQIQKNNADVIIDGNKKPKEVIGDTQNYFRNINLSIIQLIQSWKVHPCDWLTDHEWHPIDYEDLKDWVKEKKDKLDAGKELKGHTFRYRRNLHSGMYEVRLSHTFPLFHYNREPT